MGGTSPHVLGLPEAFSFLVSLYQSVEVFQTWWVPFLFLGGGGGGKVQKIRNVGKYPCPTCNASGSLC